MNKQRPPGSQILPQAAMHAQPKLLLRPRERTDVEFEAAIPVTQGPLKTETSVAEVVGFSFEELKEKAHREGFIIGVSEGRESGLNAGREEGAAHGYREGYEQGLAEGKKQGLQQGISEGLQQGEETARQELDSMRAAVQKREAQLKQLLQAIPIEFERRFAASEDDMVALVQAAVLRVLGSAFQSQDGARQALLQAVADVNTHQLISVRVHPDDFAMLRNEEEIAALQAQGISWQADRQVVLGGCFIDTREGSLDARLETQLQAFTQLLLNIRKQIRHASGEDPT